MHGWERIGALITRIARKILHIPILRYVDDFFSALRAAEAGAGARVCFRARARSFAQAEHALGCLVRLVRALLGPSALAEHKRECGNPLVILGLRIKLSPAGMRATPSDDKAKKWLCRIAEAIRADKLTAGVKGPRARAQAPRAPLRRRSLQAGGGTLLGSVAPVQESGKSNGAPALSARARVWQETQRQRARLALLVARSAIESNSRDEKIQGERTGASLDVGRRARVSAAPCGGRVDRRAIAFL